MTTWITICDTCKRENWAESGAEITDGELFAARIEEAASAIPHIKTRRTSCLMGCTRSCNVAIQATGKLAYTLGEFAPDTESAEGVVAYAALHAQSETGQVPYRTWPQAVKGHFVTRHPPLPTEE
ncbi:Predicted metal-binding protein [Cognatiyoonia koreensis]|uniref:Predicted metal-binding protein n=1 Tax=Cognatiyoonia koreensis TaxID=364200 RepID=A0A1I0RCJ7_9RHOB|nr:DUF1636 domain-containing protein [Cognatiyoonia koreensis]SEW38500.1 Predicted metal-binding protein [Cognatiyoonia koreensis]